LYLVALKFKVYVDPRIDTIEAILPGANCGGCGYAGCRAFADNLVKADDISAYFCPVGGNEVMTKSAEVLGKVAEARAPQIAVVRCNGSFSCRPRTNDYDGIKKCSFVHNLYIGNTGCPNGCLGCGDCVSACQFSAIKMDATTGLPVVTDEKCTACGACVKACPRNIIELRKKSAKDRKIFVSCMNTEKGAIAKKNCSVACIGCGKCAKICPHDAIAINNNLAFINSEKCKLCRKCVAECPTNAIVEINFPERKVSAEKESVETMETVS
jgi:Na+-translocating ferredoxin:NAD+ oxidoreductase subunit B